MSTAEAVLSEVLEAFDFGNPVVGAMRFGYGHINDTFCVHTQPKDDPCACFILQRMSSAAFKRPDQLMQNIIGVTEYLGQKIIANGGDRSREAMEVIRPKNGEDYYTDSQGGAWRVYPFVENIMCCQTADTPELFAASGRAFVIAPSRDMHIGRMEQDLEKLGDWYWLGYHDAKAQMDALKKYLEV